MGRIPGANHRRECRVAQTHPVSASPSANPAGEHEMRHPDPIRQPGFSASRLRGLPIALLLLLSGVASSYLLLTAAVSDSAVGSEGSTSARQGGIGPPGDDSGKVELAPRFGTRVLKEGMTGPDVRVLRSMVSSKALGGRSIGVIDVFDRDTRRSVERFQARKDLEKSGIVGARTAKELVGSMPRSGASWYGAPFFGGRTACGQRYTKTIIGVAHKTLPCGTRVLIGYRGRFLLTRVIDRGPYVTGRVWDLSNGARKALRYKGIDRVRHLVVNR